MFHPRVIALLEQQEGLVAVWQLERAGLTPSAIEHLVGKLRRVHDGVYLSGHGPVTERQRWWAAVLTAPGRVLSHLSAANCHGIWDRREPYTVVTRPGSGGPQRFGDVLVCRSRRLEPTDVTTVDGLPVTTAARTVLDLLPSLGERGARRLVREALRTEATTTAELVAICARHRRRPGVRRLRRLAEEYAPLPAPRTRSDAELLALELLRAWGRPEPLVNVRHAGEEADLSWPEERLIIELDGPSFHRFPTEDARKDSVWRAAGWTVHRLSTDDVYNRPERLLELAPPPRASEITRQNGWKQTQEETGAPAQQRASVSTPYSR